MVAIASFIVLDTKKRSKMRKKYRIIKDKLVIESDPTIEIPIVKILFVKLEHDASGPYIKITTVDGVIVRFWIDPSQTEKIMSMIMVKRAEVIARELRK